MNKPNLLAVCCLQLLFLIKGSAQNLVLNPSFEQCKPCGTNEIIDSVAQWQSTAGKPKFINIKCVLTAESKTYIRGMQLPDAAEGRVYAGLGIDTEGEFLQGFLEKPLVKNEIYWLKAKVRLPIRFCSAAINEVGFALTEENFTKSEDFQILKKENTALKKENNKLIDNKYEWVEISGFYTAKGGEKILTIGNFENNNKTIFADRKKSDCTYLYLDVVSVQKFEEVNLEILTEKSQIVENKQFILANIYFDEQNQLDRKSVV